MSENEFKSWAISRGLTDDVSKAIVILAATPEEMQTASEEMEPPPPVFALTDIVEMTDEDPFGISAHRNGFVVVGTCPNGDPIAIDIANEPGTVWFICHEEMHAQPLREVSIRVAGNLTELFKGIVGGDFPFDYFEAKRQAGQSNP